MGVSFTIHYQLLLLALSNRGFLFAHKNEAFYWLMKTRLPIGSYKMRLPIGSYKMRLPIYAFLTNVVTNTSMYNIHDLFYSTVL